MNKTFQDFDQIYESAARCLAADIRPSFNIIFAFPGEGAKERRETVDFMMDVCRRFPGAEFWTNIFTPYPGSPIFQRCAELGIEPPKSLEGWADFFPRYTTAPLAKRPRPRTPSGDTGLSSYRLRSNSHRCRYTWSHYTNRPESHLPARTLAPRPRCLPISRRDLAEQQIKETDGVQ